MAVLQEIKVPLLAVNDSVLTVVDISFADGQAVKKGDILLVFETSKTTYDVEAEAGGFIQYYCEAGKDYEVNELVAVIYSDAGEVVKKAAPVKAAPSGQTAAAQPVLAETALQWEGETLFSREAALLVASSGLDKKLFAGMDFVSVPDVRAKLGGQNEVKGPAKKTASAEVVKARPAVQVDREKVIVEKLSSNKKREIEYLSAVQSAGLTSTIDAFVATNGIFVHANHSLQYLKNSLLPLVIYEAGRLLKKYPLFNAYFTSEGIAFYKEVNIGFAIDIGKGLKVLKIPAANEKSLAEIEAGIMDLSGKYLDDKLAIDDLTDIGFTITDLSAEGVAFFKPLVNMMNSAILGVSAIDEKLERCILSVTFDHRVMEGKLVAGFLKDLKDRLESYRADASYRVREIRCFKCYTSLADDLSDVGFALCTRPDGQQAHICQRCLKGF